MTTVRPLLEFLTPLVVSNCVISISEHILNVGIVVSADRTVGTTVLVAFGLANYIMKLVSFPLGPSKCLGTNVGGVNSIWFVCSVGLLCGVILILLGTLSIGNFLFGQDGEVVKNARLATICLALVPLLSGVANSISGILLRRRRSLLVAASSLLETVAHFIVIGVVMLHSRYPQLRPVPPLAVPLLAIYTGVLTRLAVVVVGIVWSSPPTSKHDDYVVEGRRRYATFSDMAQFSWPFAVNELGSRSARPLVNWVISQAGETSELAALMLVYPLASLGYGWLMETKQLPASFARDSRVTSRDICVSCVSCGLFSLAMMHGLAWTAAQTWLLVAVVGASPEVAQHARPALQILSLLPLPVTVRAFYYGWASFYKRTKPLAPAAFMKSLALLASLVMFSDCGMQGAVLGSASLLCAFVVESATIVGMCSWWELHTEWEDK
mmetsp:Transcript_75642/g.162215  ORF Transcript_75642/g.162215 Transcript_75642/m.162215 type:complete len:438 (+) Transcript_75642:125-1438(+)